MQKSLKRMGFSSVYLFFLSEGWGIRKFGSHSHVCRGASVVGNVSQQVDCECRLSPFISGQTNRLLWSYSQYVEKEHSSNIWFKLIKIICFPVRKMANFIFACWTASNILFSESILLFRCTLSWVSTCLKFQSSFNFLHFLRIICEAALFVICLYARQFWTCLFQTQQG